MVYCVCARESMSMLNFSQRSIESIQIQNTSKFQCGVTSLFYYFVALCCVRCVFVLLLLFFSFKYSFISVSIFHCCVAAIGAATSVVLQIWYFVRVIAVVSHFEMLIMLKFGENFENIEQWIISYKLAAFSTIRRARSITTT